MGEQRLRVAAHLGVMDEVELIGPCIAHLRNIGVEEFIVHDMASRDGTREWLRREESESFRVIDVPQDASEDQLNESIHAAVAECRADWILKLDADEFPLPSGGDMRTVLGHHSEDVVVMPRYNVALGPDGPRIHLPPKPVSYGEIDLYAKPDPDYRQKLAKDSSLVWLRTVPAPKVAVRPSRLGHFTPGGHGAKSKTGADQTQCIADDIVIAHIALSGFDRFARKVSNITRTLDHIQGQVSGGFGWHWRRWIALDAVDGLRGEFDRSVLSSDELARLRAEGVIRTAADLLWQGGVSDQAG